MVVLVEEGRQALPQGGEAGDQGATPARRVRPVGDQPQRPLHTIGLDHRHRDRRLGHV